MSVEKDAWERLVVMGTLSRDSLFSPAKSKEGWYSSLLKAELSKSWAEGEPGVKPQGGATGDRLIKEDLKALSDAAERILDDKQIPTVERLLHLRAFARELEVSVRDSELQRFIWDARRKRAGSVDGYDPDDVIDTPDTQWLVDGVLLAGDANLVVGLPKANKTTFVLGALGAIYRGEKSFLGRELATEPPPIFIAGTDQPGHIWQQFLERSGLADETGRRTYQIVKMFTRERPIHLTPEGKCDGQGG